jgi:hypothetical protein
MTRQTVSYGVRRGGRPSWAATALILTLLVAVAAASTATATPAAPRDSRTAGDDPVARVVLGGPVVALDLGDPYAYIVVGGRFGPVDVRNPAAPAQVGSDVEMHLPRAAVVRGDVAYAAVGGFGGVQTDYYAALLAIDLADPLHPRQTDAVEIAGDDPVALAVDGDRAWVISVRLPRADDAAAAAPADARTAQSGVGGIELLDLSDPLHPKLLTPRRAPTVVASGSAGRSIAAAAGHLYTAGAESGTGIAIYGATGDVVVSAGRIEIGHTTLAVATDGDLLFAGCEDGVRVFDLLDPVHPALRSFAALPSPVSMLAADSGAVVASTRDARLHLLDVTDPDTPHDRGAFALPEAPQALAVRAPLAFAALGALGFRSIDFAVDGAPVLRGNLPTVGAPADAVVDEPSGTLWASLHNGMLLAIDRTTPGTYPVLSSSPWGPLSLPAAGDGRLYAVDGDVLRVIDASDPRAPVRLGELEMPGLAHVARAGTRCLVVGSADGTVSTVDVSDAAHPRVAGQMHGAAGHLRDLAAEAGTVFVLDGDLGIRVLDVGACGTPTEIGTLARSRLRGTMAYLAAKAQLFVAAEGGGTLAGMVATSAGASGDVPRSGLPAQQPQPTAPPPVPSDQALIVDMSDPSRPVIDGAWAARGEIRDMIAAPTWVHATYFHTRTGGFTDSVQSRSAAGDEFSVFNAFAGLALLGASGNELYVSLGDTGLVEVSFAPPGGAWVTPTVTPTPTGVPVSRFAIYLPRVMR